MPTIWPLVVTVSSLSSRRAWIEIVRSAVHARRTGRSPHGERGLKSVDTGRDAAGHGRSPHGERGLKFVPVQVCRADIQSLSSRRAWIEI